MSLAKQFPGSEEALSSLSRLVATYREELHRDPTGLELELRFGQASGPLVTTGISADFSDHVAALLRTNASLVETGWNEVQDVFFDATAPPQGVCNFFAEGARGRGNGEAGRAGRAEYRSRTWYDTDKVCIETELVTKRRLAECRLRCGAHAVRVVVSREDPCDAEAVQDMALPKHVRIQQRKSVHLTHRALGPAPTWSVDFGMVWSGATKVDAERRQMAGELPQYTLEIELADRRYVEEHSDTYVACSLALKAGDFVGSETEAPVHFVPVEPSAHPDFFSVR